MKQQSLPTRKLPAQPDLAQLKRQAKELLEDFQAGNQAAVVEIKQHFRLPDQGFALHDAQLVVARAYGFDSWPKLKAFVDGATVDRLLDAVRANDLAAVEALLRVRPELNRMCSTGNNELMALHCAVLHRLPEMVRLLLKFDTEPHFAIVSHNDGTTAYAIASERGYSEIVAIFQEAENAAPDASEENSAVLELRQALRSGDEDTTIAILESHPELVTWRAPGNLRTPLHVASALLLERVVSWLLDHGADIAAQTNEGATPLDVVGLLNTAGSKEPVIALLRQKGAALSARAAVMLGDQQFLLDLHAKGRLVPPQDDQGWLLSVAVDHNRMDLLKLLLDLGLDPDARVRVDGIDEPTFSWGVPLYQCSRYGKHAMAELLLERGADPNGQVFASGTPLSEAYGQRDEAMIALLERFGGKPNPSMAGLYRRKDLAVRLLAEHGDTKLEDDGFGSGTVAEQFIGAASRGGDPEILRMGLDHVDWPQGDPRYYGGLVSTLGFWNHWYGPWCHQEWDRTTYLTCFKMLLERIGPPTRTQRFGVSILHAIVRMGNHVTSVERGDFAQAALDAGGRLDLRDELLKSTPLGWACRWGREELVRLFLERGADPLEAEAEPWATPMAWAEKKGHPEILELLRAAAAAAAG